MFQEFTNKINIGLITTTLYTATIPGRHATARSHRASHSIHQDEGLFEHFTKCVFKCRKNLLYSVMREDKNILYLSKIEGQYIRYRRKIKKKMNMDSRPKIEVVRVSSTERKNFRPLDGVQLRAAYSHVRIGTYCPEPEIEVTTCENKPLSQMRKFKKNLGPVSRLLKRRHHGTCFATKSCDNIYNVNRNSSSLDWRVGPRSFDSAFQARQSNSLDWRIGRRINSDWRDTSRSAEHLLSRSPHINVGGLRTPTTKSKIVSLLRRLSPRLPRPGSKNSLPSSPMVCPWVRVEYSTDSVDDAKRDESQESDVSYQQELQLNELRKKMFGASPSASQLPVVQAIPTINVDSDENQNMYQREESNVDGELRSCDRAVHEDRTEEDQRRQSQCSPVHGEVAGLEQNNDHDTAVTTLPGGGGGPGGRPIRTRPLSLAVQPLHYHRVDPDIPTIITTTTKGRVTSKHPNMTSQDSIGSCSLDVDRSASDRSETTVGSVSEKTLHSLNLSSNGDIITPVDIPVNGNSNSEVIQQQSQISPLIETSIDNLNGDNEPEQLTAKKPSYLGLACSISGYSGITRYDSKLREGFRSRDSSPGSRLITRETSPAGFRSNENLGVPTHSYPIKSQSISPLAMDRQNGFSNGNKECKVETFVESRSSLNICQGYSEVDRGVSLHPTFADISPIRGNSNIPAKKTMGMTPLSSCNRETKSFKSSVCVSSPHTSNNHHDSSFSNGSSIEIENQTINISSSSEKSFIQQRVERLYGPGALAQGFFFKRGSNNSISSESSFNKSSNNNDISTDNANTEESLKNLPVLRHLRPEFRAQLPVVSPRRPTDGSEQVVKPLQRISISSRKNEVTVKVPVVAQNVVKVHDTFNDSLKLSASMTSITDQQPAAPEVVLPVLEPSASSTNLAEQPKVSQESSNAVVEKDGHYFIKLLKAEIERLFVLAASAEVELESDKPLPEEAAGKLRSAAGKARLLATQKMQQFEGLCQKNINQVPGEEFPTTNEDLAGFWDMVMLQVVQVNNIFEHIDKLRNSQWQEVIPEKPVVVAAQNGNNTKRRVVITQKPKPTANSEANRKAREAREQARRQMLEDRRKAMKSKVQQSVEIYAPKT